MSLTIKIFIMLKCLFCIIFTDKLGFSSLASDIGEILSTGHKVNIGVGNLSLNSIISSIVMIIGRHILEAEYSSLCPFQGNISRF